MDQLPVQVQLLHVLSTTEAMATIDLHTATVVLQALVLAEAHAQHIAAVEVIATDLAAPALVLADRAQDQAVQVLALVDQVHVRVVLAVQLMVAHRAVARVEVEDQAAVLIAEAEDQVQVAHHALAEEVVQAVDHTAAVHAAVEAQVVLVHRVEVRAHQAEVLAVQVVHHLHAAVAVLAVQVVDVHDRKQTEQSSLTAYNLRV